MSHFHKALAARNSKAGARRWLFVAYDQLSSAMGPLSREAPETLGIVLVESPFKAGLRPYHKQKLAAVLTNLRHFALEQAERGVAVEHVVCDGPYRNALEPLAKKLGPLRMMRAAERELREDLKPLIQSGAIEEIAHEGWITSAKDFAASQKKAPYRMDRFYRHVRERLGILMDARGKPVGGKFSFDEENRKKWSGKPAPPALPQFEPDEITLEVGRLVEERFAKHPGKLDLTRLPATAADADEFWGWAKRSCLPLFGPFEDAMSAHERTLFHTRVSMLVNLGRLLPGKLVRDVEALDIPLASKEGFIRQVLGWREFMHHVHEATDGFRAGKVELAPDGSASPSLLGARQPLPPVYWGTPSGLRCVDTTVTAVWDEGYSHHITRLMVLSNLANLLDLSPRELTDWFWVAYVDAYDWVVEPNVLAMGTWAVGDLVVTKPYVASANYINKQSDFCRDCAFDPKQNCPFTRLYWAFLERHRSAIGENPRMFRIYSLLANRKDAEKRLDAQAFETVREALARGDRLDHA